MWWAYLLRIKTEKRSLSIELEQRDGREPSPISVMWFDIKKT